MTTYERFRNMFNLPEEQQMETWNGLTGLMEEGGALMIADLPSISWLSDELPAMITKHLEAGKAEGEWVSWATKGIQKKRVRFQQVDLTQMVAAVNRWGKHTGSRRLSAGDFVTLPNGSKTFQWGYEVGVMMDISSLVLECDPVVWIPNVPIPAALLSEDRKSVIFVAPMIGKGEDCPKITEVQPTATFEAFFS